MSFSVQQARIAFATLFTTAVVFPSIYQPLLTPLWTFLRHSTIYRASTFETFWTVFCYAAIEVPVTVAFINNPSWRLAHRKNGHDEPPKKPKGMRRPSRRLVEGLTYIAPLLALDLLMIKKFANVPLEDMLRSGNYDLEDLNRSHQSTFLVPSLHNFTPSSPLQTERALPTVAPTSRRLALELVTSIVLYDALFFLFHLSMHHLPVLRSWHAPHHTHAEMHPQITNQLHVFERLGLVLLANFSLNIIGSHVLTRTLFVPLFVWLLVEIHSGLDLPWGYDKILPEGWGGGAKKHALHHQSGGGNLAPYFEWCDGALRRCQAWVNSENAR
ncbi:hypothetical protein MBLNU230_g7996t1 [Neophaeotheca triangularis]